VGLLLFLWVGEVPGGGVMTFCDYWFIYIRFVVVLGNGWRFAGGVRAECHSALSLELSIRAMVVSSFVEDREYRSDDLELDFYGSAEAFTETAKERMMREGEKVLKLNPWMSRNEVMGGMTFYRDGHLRMWDLSDCRLRAVPSSLVLLYTKFPFVFALPEGLIDDVEGEVSEVAVGAE
jgi:hypothetical protein